MSQSTRGLKNRKRQERRMVIIAAVVILIIAVAGGIGLSVLNAKGSRSESKNTKQAKVKELEIKTEDASEEAGTDEKAGADGKSGQVADRSDFAVEPGKPVGVLEESAEKVVYLTLDDGPSMNTQAVLDILDKYNAKATFFVTNQNPEYLYLIKEAYDKGHTIGLHTYSHDYASLYSSVDAYFADLDQIGQVVKEQIGYVPCFIRFPGGSSNTISADYTSGIMTTLAQEVQARGYQYYDWNCSSGDGSVQPVENIIALGTSSSDNNVMLLSHDANGKETTVQGLPAIIEHYQSLGYTFKGLDRQSFAAHHGINN